MCPRTPQQVVNNTHCLSHVTALGLKFNFQKCSFQGNESYPHKRQKAGVADNLSKVPGPLKAALYQLPKIGRPSHSSVISHTARSVAYSSIPMLVDSQMFVTGSQLTHSGLGHNLLRRGVPIGLPPAHRELVTTDASLSGWGGLWQHQGI